MPTCRGCAGALAERAPFCPDCGLESDLSADVTRERPESPAAAPGPEATPPRRSRPSSGSGIDHGRFLPGTLIGERYRIVGRLGRGGMGEVYRADDLTLGQAVALKFLPERVARDPDRLQRLLDEVRLARQVSHPNVCRVYDVGEADGEHFLSMEHVQGEDLATLLHRIGRLPHDKALQISRQLCAGIAAAHEKGVLHRDLKPANVMLDDAGVVRVTDFGLAVAGEVRGGRVLEGTPAYMAPEQLAGRGVSVRSDVYAIGLVLYELFTGRRAFEGESMTDLLRVREEAMPPPPSSMIEDLDPAVERAILRCLANEPQQRPPTALAVAAALPGGDPLAAALAAGETPSPEMVAAAGEAVGIEPRTALACMAGILMGIVAILALGARMSLLSRVPLEYPPPVLAAKAREIAGRLGYDQRPLDTAYGFRGAGREFVRKMRAADPAARSWEGAILMRPPLVRFWYRDSPRLLEPISFFGRPGGGAVSWFDPPSDVSGMKALELDTEGRLVSFSAVPPQVDDPPPATVREPDWPVLFAAAGLDPARFRTAAPRWAPAGLADSRAAWEGTYADRPSLTVRVEAAGYRGRPTYFEIVTPWTRPARMQEFRPTPGQRAGQIIATTMLLAMTVGGLLVVRRSLRLGRGDRRGAVRLAVFAIAASCLGWALGADHVANLSEVGLIVMAVCWSLFMGALVWMLYVAAEPFVRRRWPGVLISWTRLLAGRLRDPLVGRDLLLGAALGVAIVLSGTLQAIVRRALGAEPETGVLSFSFALLPTRDVFSQLCFQPLNAVFVAVLVLFFLVLLRALLRREWLAASAFVLVFSAPSILQPETTAFDAAFRIAISVAVVLVVIRAGMVAAVAGFVTINLLGTAWIGTDLTAWYTLPAWINVSVVAVLALYGFHTALAGRPLFKDGLLEP